MAATIVNVIYGFPLNQKHDEKITEWEEDLDSPFYATMNGVCGFRTMYSGYAMKRVGYCGVSFYSFMPSEDHLVDDLVLEPTEEQKQEALEKIEKVPQELRDLADEIGVYFVASTT